MPGATSSPPCMPQAVRPQTPGQYREGRGSEGEIGSRISVSWSIVPSLACALPSAISDSCPSPLSPPQWGWRSLWRQGHHRGQLDGLDGKWGRGAKDDIHSSYKAELDRRRVAQVKVVFHARVVGQARTCHRWLVRHVKPLTTPRSNHRGQCGNTQEPTSRSCWAYTLGARPVLPRLPSNDWLAAAGEYRRHVCGLYWSRRRRSYRPSHRQARFLGLCPIRPPR